MIFWSCQTTSNNKSVESYKKIYPEYAKGFSINQYKHKTSIVVYTDFIHADSFEVFIPDSIESIACLSSTHLACIVALGHANRVCAFSSVKYMYAPEKYKSDIIEIGEPHDMDYEKIKLANPSLIILFGLDQKIKGTLDQLEKMHIPAMLNLEYREEHPLAQAEWIKFFGYIFKEEHRADSIFNEVKKNYLTLKATVSHESAPSVMVNLPWRGQWYISGNNTLIAAYIKDAGGNYLFQDAPFKGTQAISFEEVYKKAQNADVWLHPGTAFSKKQMEEMDPHSNQFAPFKKNRIFNNNKRVNKSGCNDFFESATIRPDIVLSDLIKIFQQDTNNLFYYQNI